MESGNEQQIKSQHPFLITTDPLSGQKEWTAASNLKSGTILIDEFPAFLAPLLNADHLFGDKCLLYLCISCAGEITMQEFEDGKNCKDCGCPTCSLECQLAPIHKENECKYLAQPKFKYPLFCDDGESRGIIQFLIPTTCVAMLRGMGLKKYDPLVYAELTDLMSTHPVFSTQSAIEDISELSWQLLKEVCSNLLEHPEEDYKRILGITQINSFSVCQGTTTAVYLKTSRMNHSCSPNCIREIDSDFKIRIRTCVDIQQGEPLTITYFQKEFLGTIERQLFIKKYQGCGGFVCRCRRCIDPTEMGSFMSAIKCALCSQVKAKDFSVPPSQTMKFFKEVANDGYLLPLDPLDTQDGANWQCNNCGNTQTMDSFSVAVEEIYERIKRAKQEKAEEGIQICKEVIQKYGGIFLHPNHWVIQEAAKVVIDGIDSLEPDEVKREDLELHIQLSIWLLNIKDKVMPGINTERYSLLRYASRSLAEMAIKFSEKKDRDQISGFIELARKMQLQSQEYQEGLLCPVVDPKFQEEIKDIEMLSNLFDLL